MLILTVSTLVTGKTLAPPVSIKMACRSTDWSDVVKSKFTPAIATPPAFTSTAAIDAGSEPCGTTMVMSRSEENAD